MLLKIKIKISSSNSTSFDIAKYLDSLKKQRRIESRTTVRMKNHNYLFSVYVDEKQYQKFLRFPLDNRDITEFSGILFIVKSFKVIIE